MREDALEKHLHLGLSSLSMDVSFVEAFVLDEAGGCRHVGQVQLVGFEGHIVFGGESSSSTSSFLHQRRVGKGLPAKVDGRAPAPGIAEDEAEEERRQERHHQRGDENEDENPQRRQASRKRKRQK